MNEHVSYDETAVKNDKCCGLNTCKTAALVVAGAIGALALTNKVIAARTPPLGHRLHGTFNRYPFRQGDLAYTVAGSGSPILLLHSIGTGSSSLEWGAILDELAQEHTVYALDFLGFGLSDKPEAHYSAYDFIEQIQFFAEDVIGEPCAVIASNQSAVFAIEAAARAPELFSNLILISPPAGYEESEQSHLQSRIVNALLGIPVLGTTLYNAITSRRGIENTARRQLYFDKGRVDDNVVRSYHVAAHQGGAQYGVFSLLAGALDHDAREAWSRLSLPTLLVWGRNARPNGIETAPEWLSLKPDAELEIVDNAMSLPHEEHPSRFCEIVTGWLNQN